MSPEGANKIMMDVGTTGLKQSWFQRGEVKDAIKAAFAAGRRAGPAISHVEYTLPAHTPEELSQVYKDFGFAENLEA